MPPSSNRLIRLRDGRRLSYATFGDPAGAVVVNAHGGLACRLDVASAHAAASAAGIRLVSPDRPGVGHSDPQPGRTVLDWAADVVELLDQLEVDRFAAMGWSMGGQYAAALGFALPGRVTRVAIVAGALPLDGPGVFAQLPFMDRAYTRLSQRAPWIARACFRSMSLIARVAPSVNGRLAARELGPADGAVIRAEGFAAFSAMMHEGLRQPRGVVEEYRAWMRPWGFRLEDVTVPVDVWAGTEDELIDRDWPAELARRVPGAVLHLRPGGHLVAHSHYPEIFERLGHGGQS
ncbi:alpha/beta fold hydrolase [Mycolicibacterium lacusdiani]|uniref:alpha/beta fold hydrolase n=1 Tax=Mycolicibacterium lacusdiani TaxID=2895283 RepID=UPI001F22F743|nr:alpha/beta hydrolase [Mycolicibacterium lacusdiani]